MGDLPDTLSDFEKEEIDTPLGSVQVKFFEIDDRNLHQEMNRQAEDLVYFSGFEAAAAKEVAQVEQELEEREAELWGKFQGRDVPGRKNPRVSDIESWIAQDDEIKELKRKLIEYEYQLEQFKLIRRAVQEKGKMLQSKVGLRRSEIQEDIEMSRSSNALRKDEEENNA